MEAEVNSVMRLEKLKEKGKKEKRVKVRIK